MLIRLAARAGLPAAAASITIAAVLFTCDMAQSVLRGPDLVDVSLDLVAFLLVLAVPVLLVAATVGLLVGVLVGWALEETRQGPLDAPGAMHKWSTRVSVTVVAATAAVSLLILVGAAPEDAVTALKAPNGPVPAGSPNVVLIVVDSLRADGVQDDRFGFSLAPSLDALSASSIVFANAIAASSWTRPSTAAILTGRYPSAIGSSHGSLGSGADTLAEMLWRAGFHTAAFSDNYLTSPASGFEQGFERFFVRNNYLAIRQMWLFQMLPDRLAQRLRRRFRLIYLGGETLIGPIERYLTTLEDERPFFLYVHLMDPHYPFYVYGHLPENVSNRADADHFVPFGDWLEQVWDRPYVDRIEASAAEIDNAVTRYLGAIQYADGIVGDVLSMLKGRPDWDNTLVVVTADHGEEFFEHGLFSHGQSLYQELIHVPLLIRPHNGWTGSVRRGEVAAGLVSATQLPATILRMAGINAPRHLEPAIGHLFSRGAHDAYLPRSELRRRGRVLDAVLGDTRKVIRVQKDGLSSYEVYDWLRDTTEQDDLARTEPLPRRLVQHLRRPHGENEYAEEAPQPLSGEELERLRALGYVLESSPRQGETGAR